MTWCQEYDLAIQSGKWYPARCIDTDCAAAATCARDVVGHPHVNYQELS